MNKYLCFDIGGTYIKYGILSQNGEVILKDKYKTERKDKVMFLKSIVDLIEIHKIKNKIKGVCICVPGIVDPYEGTVKLCYAIKFLDNMNIKKFLEDKCKITIEIENDANCAGLAEKFTGAAEKCNDFVCMTIGTGIGGCIFSNGLMVRGSRFMGGEFGFMITEGINENNKGLELIDDGASVQGLIIMYKKLKNIKKEVNVTGEMVFRYGEYDKEVKELMDTWYKRLSYAIFNLAGMLNPEKILIGGGISSRENFIDNIIKYLNKIKWWKDIEVKIEPCHYKNDAGMIGALYNFLTIKHIR